LRIDFKGIPVSVIAIACLYLVVGVGGLVVHFDDPRAPDWIWVEVTELLAVVCGVFLLRGRNWARWLAGAWMAFHVVISVGDWGRLAIHGLFLALIAWCLFRPDASRYFKNKRTA
jgi:uncharacterized membrane protein HdeD (DUF308 family)